MAPIVGTEALALLPLALVPTVAVPLAIALHIVSLRLLRTPDPGVDQAEPAAHRADPIPAGSAGPVARAIRHG